MDSHIKHLFSTVLFYDDVSKRGKPDNLPDSLIKLHDDAELVNRRFCTKTRVDSDQYWLMLRLDEMIKRIAELESIVLSPKSKEPVVADEPKQPKIDMRTKEGRELKAAGVP